IPAGWTNPPMPHPNIMPTEVAGLLGRFLSREVRLVETIQAVVSAATNRHRACAIQTVSQMSSTFLRSSPTPCFLARERSPCPVVQHPSTILREFFCRIYVPSATAEGLGISRCAGLSPTQGRVSKSLPTSGTDLPTFHRDPAEPRRSSLPDGVVRGVIDLHFDGGHKKPPTARFPESNAGNKEKCPRMTMNSVGYRARSQVGVLGGTCLS